MHPFLRSLVIAVVGLIISGGLLALALLGENSELSVIQMLLAGVVAFVVGGFLFVQAWRWSQRAWHAGSSGVGVLIAVTGGIAGVLGMGAFAGVVILLLLFYVN
ncbi:MAG TPA: hypothetical protein VFM19_05445 [Candidatus Limnocylindria bacterium]|nr:hypothetical protein [Candidatus Limnocylindria bacterium]